ncbi:MAG: hybrid sensor histidine kinase/response regulator [Myxococcota bacterium]
MSMNQMQSLLMDLSLVLELCLSSSEAEDLDGLMEQFIERAVNKLGAQDGALFVRGSGPSEIRAYPSRRAERLFSGRLGEGARAALETRLQSGPPRLAPIEDSVGGPALGPARLAKIALSVPIQGVGLLELYSKDPGVLEEHDGRVLSSLVGFLAGRIRSAEQAQSLEDRAQRAERAHQAIEELLSSLPGAVLAETADGKVELMSKGALRLFEVEGPPPRALRSPRERCIDQAESVRIEEQLKAAVLARQSDVVLRYRYTAENGPLRYRDLEERIKLLYDREGKLVRRVSFLADMTEERRAQRRLDELTVQRTAVARADALRVDTERALKAKTEFLNLLSHELRAPLFPIIALSDLLLRGDGQPEAEKREQLKMINSAGKQMLELVSDLLDISRVDAGRWRPTAAPVALPHLVAMIGERCGAAPGRLEIAVKTEIGSTDVYTDRLALERILQGLVSNALELPGGGATQLEVLVLPGAVRISVRARAAAPAVLPEDPNDVFEPFWERSGEPRPDARGRGLALTVVKRLALALGGSVRASIEGEQRSWIAEIPAAKSQRLERGARPARALIGSADLAVAFPVAILAQAQGADTRIVQSVAEAMELFRQRAFDVFLVDVRIPGLRVLEDVLLIERQNANAHPMVIGLSRPADPLALTGAVLDASLALPVTQQALEAVLARL